MDLKDREQTLVLIKPDALKNSLTGYVLSQLSEFHTGLCFAGMKIVHVSRMLAQEHYAELRNKSFFSSLIDCLTGVVHYPHDAWKRRVVAIVYMGTDAVHKIRELAGPTDPVKARETRPGCIRSLGMYVPEVQVCGKTIGDRMDNLIHASATVEQAQHEITMWFCPGDIPSGMHAFATAEADTHFYCKSMTLYSEHVPGSVCIIAPGDTVWKSDLEALQMLSRGDASPATLESVIAKYFMNDMRDMM